jgi:hypothetical protein
MPPLDLSIHKAAEQSKDKAFGSRCEASAFSAVPMALAVILLVRPIIY